MIGHSINTGWMNEWIRLTPLICQESMKIDTRQVCFVGNIGKKKNKPGTLDMGFLMFMLGYVH